MIVIMNYKHILLLSKYSEFNSESKLKEECFLKFFLSFFVSSKLFPIILYTLHLKF